MQKFDKYLHVVAFDVPYPADYGGVIDIFYKLKSLHDQGIGVILHSYQYGRSEQQELLKWCKEVHYYPRKTLRNPFYGSVPYIVRTRNSDELLQNLLKDGFPILFEGLHCTYYLDHPQLKNRFKVVRTHNIEHDYYKSLELSETKYFKKYFFKVESERLERYEEVLKHADLIAAISPEDYKYFNERYDSAIYVPAFHSNSDAKYPQDKGDFVLYHGNLGVSENYEAALELIRNVFSKWKLPVIIAGNNPNKELEKEIELYDHIQLVTKTTTDQLHKLIAEAKINMLHTNQATGIKLKLINALYQGKFAIVNPLMVENTGLEPLCVICNDFEAMRKAGEEYFEKEFSINEFNQRMEYLNLHFSNKSSAKKLVQSIDFQTDSKAVKRVSKKVRSTLISSLRSYFLP
ncbi:glycosyltransferase [bacterium]|nr:glycosyltransferase [bacterium]